MAVKLVFLGKLADLAGAHEKKLPAPLDWNGLVAALGTVLTGDKVKLALGGKILADKFAVLANDGDEIALLPPVSGG